MPSANAHSASLAGPRSSATKNEVVSHSLDSKSNPFETALLPSYRGSLASLSTLQNLLPTNSASPESTIDHSSTDGSKSPSQSQNLLPTYGQDTVYVMNAQQFGHTDNFSASSPSWGVTSTLVFTPNDFILDPQDPYNTAWVAADNGIWRTTNLGVSAPLTPTWKQVLSMTGIISLVAASGITTTPPFLGVSRIAGDVSRPGYFFVVLNSNADSLTPSGVVGWTTDSGGTWVWQQLPSPPWGHGPGTHCGLTTGLAVSQDGSGQIWLGTCISSAYGYPSAVYSKNYGQTWQTIWYDNGFGA